MKKILYTASTDLHLLTFHLPYIDWLKSEGYEVHVAYNGERTIPHIDKIWKISFGRSPFDLKNKKAYSALKEIINDNQFELIHCHTPMASVITRLAAQNARKKGTKVFYTTHGFHFYKGAPLKNWLVFFPIEWVLSHITDAIITINEEDYQSLFKYKFGSFGKHKINGIGVNPKRINIENINNITHIKNEFGYSEKDFIILYLAEFSHRKNHQFIFKLIPKIIKEIPSAKFLFAGENTQTTAQMFEYTKEMKIQKAVNIVGFKDDVNDLIAIADIGISASFSEGLPMGVSEMMYAGIPQVVSDIRGHRDLIENNINGFLFDLKNANQFIECIMKLYDNEILRKDKGEQSKKSIEKFMIKNSLSQMIKIYKQVLN